MLDFPKDERSEKDQKHKKQLEEMNNDLLALLRCMDHLGVKLVMLKTEENPSSKYSSSSTLENQQEDQYDDKVDEDSHEMFGDSDGEDDARACFPCPFCYVDIDLSMLCSHFQEDHCFDLKNAVCPLCAANLGKDVTGHFIVQHASSLKRRKKSEKSGFLTGNSVMLGKKFPTNAVGNKPESAPDPLLSLFINNNMHFLDPKCIQQDECFRDDASDTSDVKSMEPSSLDEGHEQDNEERRQKAAFVQQLIMSTIF